ncbi:MAG TPA: SDR family NAD(P)-dependent oxidoreductase [Candidatus Methylomirabilis sp.]|nr:SDR family NAD(P)-dependent oxidoreductase [Candidatus Methylomirabilis sp.]
MRRLSGKVAMVTGCGGEHGIGRGIARRLAADGADLVLTDVAPRGIRIVSTKPETGWGGLEAVAEEVRAVGQRAITALLDVRSAAQIERVITKTLDAFAHLDILVNNAAAPPGADRVPVVELSEEAWDVVLDTNLKGSFLCAKAAATLMLRQKIRGRIINIASDRAKIGTANLAAYCSSKFGLVGFTQSLAMELAPAGITVNAICPGGVDSERLDYLGRREDGAYDQARRVEKVKQLSAAVPLGRLTRPEDVAEVAAFLASDAAEYITGQAINVSGGSIRH